MGRTRSGRIAVLIAMLTAGAPAVAGEWSLRLGEMNLEGISVDESVAGERYHLGLTSETAWFTFSFPAAGGGRPSAAAAERVNLTGFDPDIQCTDIGPDGLELRGDTIAGSVICSSPGGILMLNARFEY